MSHFWASHVAPLGPFIKPVVPNRFLQLFQQRRMVLVPQKSMKTFEIAILPILAPFQAYLGHFWPPKIIPIDPIVKYRQPNLLLQLFSLDTQDLISENSQICFKNAILAVLEPIQAVFSKFSQRIFQFYAWKAGLSSHGTYDHAQYPGAFFPSYLRLGGGVFPSDNNSFFSVEEREANLKTS